MARALSSLELRMQESRNEGINENKSEIAMRLLSKGLDTQFVGEVTKLSQDRIEQIQRELKNNA